MLYNLTWRSRKVIELFSKENNEREEEEEGDEAIDPAKDKLLDD